MTNQSNKSEKSDIRKKVKSIIMLVIFALLVVYIYCFMYTYTLNVAIEHNNINQASVLLHLPGDVNRSNKVPIVEYYGSSPLTTACEFGRVEIVKLLIARGADVNNPRGAYAPPIKMALRSRNPNQLETIKLLIENGVNINDPLAGGGTPIYALFDPYNAYPYKDYSDEEQIAEIFFFLLENGVEINPKGGLLHSASADNNIEVVRYLVEEKGFDVNSQNAAWTPLMSAAFWGSTDVAEYLLSKGANPKIRSHYEELAIDIAKSMQREEIVELLINYDSYNTSVDTGMGDIEDTIQIDEKAQIAFDYVKNNEALLNNIVDMVSKEDEDYIRFYYSNDDIKITSDSERVLLENVPLISAVREVLTESFVDDIVYTDGIFVINLFSETDNRWLVYKEEKPEIPEQYVWVTGNWYYRNM